MLFKIFPILFFLHHSITPTIAAQPRGMMTIPPTYRDEQGNTIINRPTIPLVIKKPGSYKLINDLKTDTSTTTTLITIQSNNVRLNLNGRSLYLTSKSGKKVTGVYIQPECSNITIENGSINNITGKGVIVGQNSFNITLHHLVITGAQQGGIQLQDYVDTTFINNCLIGNSISCDQTNIGIQLTKNNNITISNCSILDLNGTNKYNTYGIFAKESHYCSYYDCVINGIKGKNVIAFAMNRCSGSTFFNNESNGNIGLDGSSTAFYLVNSDSNTISSFSALNNKATKNAYGIQLKGRSTFNKFESCICNHNQSTKDGNGYGVYVTTGTGNKFSEIDAFANTGGSSITSEGVGIKIQSTEGITVEKSRFHYNNGGNGKGYGILLKDSNECIIEDNLIYYNKGKSGSWGIYETGTPSSYIGSNTSFGNITNYGLQQTGINAIQAVRFDSPRSVQKTSRGNVDIKSA
jgi:parallel beta-helix repeat protein